MRIGQSGLKVIRVLEQRFEPFRLQPGESNDADEYRTYREVTLREVTSLASSKAAIWHSHNVRVVCGRGYPSRCCAEKRINLDHTEFSRLTASLTGSLKTHSRHTLVLLEYF